MAKKYKADLHIHTNCSDCTYAPREVVKQAAAAGLTTIAITDHDTLEGVPEAMQAGRKFGVEVIAGIEMSAYHEDQEFHIVGLLVDTTQPAFLEKLRDLRKARRERIFEIVDRLGKVGVDLDGNEILAQADGGAPTRAHVAQMLIERGYANHIGEAFSSFIGESGPGFVPKKYVSVEETCEDIRNVGGVSILAHPGLTDRDQYIPLFAEMGLNGIEAIYHSYTNRLTRHYMELAAQHNLLISGGSDYHGTRKAETNLGKTFVPEVFVERIKATAMLLPGTITGRAFIQDEAD